MKQGTLETRGNKVKGVSGEVSEYHVLMALADKTNCALGAHVSSHAILCKFSRNDRGDAKSSLKSIVKKGLAQRHPTRGEMTFHLTRLGLRVLQRRKRTSEGILDSANQRFVRDELLKHKE